MFDNLTTFDCEVLSKGRYSDINHDELLGKSLIDFLGEFLENLTGRSVTLVLEDKIEVVDVIQAALGLGVVHIILEHIASLLPRGYRGNHPDLQARAWEVGLKEVEVRFPSAVRYDPNGEFVGLGLLEGCPTKVAGIFLPATDMHKVRA